MVAHAPSEPSLDEQEQFWDLWNGESRVETITPYVARLRDVAVRWARRQGGRPRTLEIGCGAGWMAHGLAQLGPVVAIDLSPLAIEAAKKRFPEVEFIAGDFYVAPLKGPFDVITTADTLAHVPDQQGFIDRVAQLLAPGGSFVLMTQHPYAYSRSSWVRPVAPGQLRRWLSLRALRPMLERDFEIEHVTTAAPGGATNGIYWFTNSRRVWRLLCRLIGEARAVELYERLWLGNELVVIARRR
jgi:2-polyprenyl-3-methyl-5-hydroxy-6-metoxy-1,4-benzoquinol methylase